MEYPLKEKLYAIGYILEYINYQDSINYYEMAIRKGNSKAIYKLVNYCKMIKDYEGVKKYYLMGVKKGNSRSMHNLAVIYGNEGKYEESKKYYLMAVEKGNSVSMNNLATYYKTKEINYEEAKKYYLMSITRGNTKAMENLADLYHYIYGNFKEAKKYYLMAIKFKKTSIVDGFVFKSDEGDIRDLEYIFINQLYEKSSLDFLSDKIKKIYNNNRNLIDKKIYCDLLLIDQAKLLKKFDKITKKIHDLTIETGYNFNINFKDIYIVAS